MRLREHGASAVGLKVERLSGPRMWMVVIRAVHGTSVPQIVTSIAFLLVLEASFRPSLLWWWAE